jgi:hypothetical protein
MSDHAAYATDRPAGPPRAVPTSPWLLPGFDLAAWAGALLGLVGALAGRAIAPSLAGVWMGTDRLIPAAELGAATLTQLFAIVAVALLMGLLLAISRSSWPGAYRAFAVFVCGPVAVAVSSAMFIPLPDLSGLVAGTGAAAFAVLAGVYGLKPGRPRLPAVVVGAVGLGGLGRMAAIGLLQAGEPGLGQRFRPFVTAGTMLSFGLDVVVVLVSVLWLVSGWPGVRRGFVGAGVAATGLALAALGIVALAVIGAGPEASGAAVLANRALGQLMTQPGPAVPNWLRGLVEVQCVVLAAAALCWPRTSRLLRAGLVLALVGRGAPEAPLCALAMVLAALLVSLAPSAEVPRSARPVPEPEPAAEPEPEPASTEPVAPPSPPSAETR